MQEIRDMEKMAHHGAVTGRWAGVGTKAAPKPLQAYALGFCFNAARTHVRLIKKLRPTWQAGFFNGIGGHVEPGETPIEGMVREYQEEAGVQTEPEYWDCFAIMSGAHRADGGAIVYCYETVNEHYYSMSRTCTDEPIYSMRVDMYLDPALLLPNLPILLPLALDRDTFQRPANLVWPAAAPRGDGDGFNHTR